MRALFGVVSLLVVLAVAGLLAARQLRAVAPAAVGAGASSAQGASAPAGTPRQVQDQVRADLDRAMAQNARKLEEANP